MFQKHEVIPNTEIKGTTHVMTEVLYHHSEYSDGFGPEYGRGYYLVLWPLAIPKGEDIPESFEERLTYHIYSPYIKHLFASEEFSYADFDSAVVVSKLVMPKIVNKYARIFVGLVDLDPVI